MTGEGVPRLPASLDCSDEEPPPYGLQQALEHAFLRRDFGALQRIARQAELHAADLRARIAQLEAVPRMDGAAGSTAR